MAAESGEEVQGCHDGVCCRVMDLEDAKGLGQEEGFFRGQLKMLFVLDFDRMI